MMPSFGKTLLAATEEAEDKLMAAAKWVAEKVGVEAADNIWITDAVADDDDEAEEEEEEAAEMPIGMDKTVRFRLAVSTQNQIVAVGDDEEMAARNEATEAAEEEATVDERKKAGKLPAMASSLAAPPFAVAVVGALLAPIMPLLLLLLLGKEWRR